MPTSPLKRPSGGGGGRLRRLLASLRSPARAGPLPVQTGFPTSLADIVVKNHGRLRNSRRRHRATGAGVPPPAAAAKPTTPEPLAQERRELSAAHDAAAKVPAPVPASGGRGAGGFSIRPGLVAAGGAMALVLLVIWSKQLVAAATLASVALSWIESARTVRARWPETEEVELSSRRGRVRVSPIREAAESPRPSCGSDDGGSDAASRWSADSGGDGSSPVNNNSPKLKQSRRSLRKLLTNKLRHGKRLRDKCSGNGNGGEAGELEHEHEHEHPSAGETNAEPAEEAITDDDDRRQSHRRLGRALPLCALVPVILAGLVAGKLPAVALAVLCAAFSSSVERVPAGAGQASSCR